MGQINLGLIGEGGDDIRFDMAIINKVVYSVEIHPNRSTWVKVCTIENEPAPADAHILRVVGLWAGRPNYAGLNLQKFIKKMIST